MKMKYIVVKANDYRTGKELSEFPIMFPANIVHKDMYDASRYGVAEGGDYRVSECVGAGFCNLDKDSSGEMIVNCFGESESLGVKSRYEKDNAAFKRCHTAMSSTRVN